MYFNNTHMLLLLQVESMVETVPPHPRAMDEGEILL
jgi:hypothetical protein